MTAQKSRWTEGARWAAFLVLVLSACAAKKVQEPDITMDEFKFEIDRDGSFEPDEEWLRFNNPRLSTRGTPNILSGVGIAINAPREVQFSDGPNLEPKDAQFIICMASNFVHDTLGLGSSFIESIAFVVVDARTHKEYLGSAARAHETNMWANMVPYPDDLPKRKTKPKTDHSKSTFGEVLRGNLAGIIRLPAIETEYVIYAALGPYRSNSLTVKLVRRPETR